MSKKHSTFDVLLALLIDVKNYFKVVLDKTVCSNMYNLLKKNFKMQFFAIKLIYRNHHDIRHTIIAHKSSV